MAQTQSITKVADLTNALETAVSHSRDIRDESQNCMTQDDATASISRTQRRRMLADLNRIRSMLVEPADFLFELAGQVGFLTRMALY